MKKGRMTLEEFENTINLIDTYIENEGILKNDITESVNAYGLKNTILRHCFLNREDNLIYLPLKDEEYYWLGYVQGEVYMHSKTNNVLEVCNQFSSEKYFSNHPVSIMGRCMGRADLKKWINKHIPLKPYIKKEIWLCPNCDEEHKLKQINYNYCSKCGQKIDWGHDK